MKKGLLQVFAILILICIGLCCVSCGGDKEGADKTSFVPVGTSTQNKNNYEIKPTITIETGEYSLEEVSFAVIGLDYKVFSAKAVDVYNDSIAVTTTVYYNYYTQTRAEVPLVNNSFVPSMYGIYTVEYVATDSFGNNTVITYDVVCKEKQPFSVSFGEKTTTGTVGNSIVIAPISFNNAIGRVNYSVQAISKNNYATYDIGQGTSFIPEYAGDYEIKYICNDYNETAVVSYDLSISDNPLPIFKSEVVLNDYYIVDCAYELPMPNCYYSKAGTRYDVVPMIFVEYYDGSQETLKDGKFKPSKEGEAVVTYWAQFGSAVASKQYNVRTVDVGHKAEMDMSKYFYSDSIFTNALEYGVSITSRTDCDFDFINPISASTVYMKFAIDGDNNNFEQLDFFITDEKDSNLSIKFTIKKDIRGCVFYVNDNDYTYASASFYGNQSIEFNFDNNERQASLNGATIDVDKYYNGEDFNGFSGDKVCLSFAFDGVVENAGILFYQLDNTVFSKARSDSFEPYITFTRFVGDKLIGDEVEIERVYVTDVLDPEYTVKYTVTGPDGQFVTSLDGKILDGTADYRVKHRFVVSMLGRYVVSIYIADSFGNGTTYSYALEVKDNIGPSIVLGDGDTTVSVNKKITLKTAAATDNFTDKFEFSVFVRRPDYSYDEATNGGTYTPTQSGVYTVFYYTFDEHGNISIESYTFTAE